MTLINTTNIPVTDFLSKYSAGKFRFITKCRAGFLTVVDSRHYDLAGYLAHPETLLTGFKKGALQTVQFQPDGTENWLTLFARVGKRVYLIDTAILRDLSVGTINQYFHNTNLSIKNY